MNMLNHAIVRIHAPQPTPVIDLPEPPIAKAGRHVPGLGCSTCLAMVARGEDLMTTFQIAQFFQGFEYAIHFGTYTAFGPSADEP